MTTNSTKSCLSVAKYILVKAEEQSRMLTPMKLIKLVYMAHGWMLGLYGRPLFRENAEAWKYGPVIRELYREVKQYRNNSIPPSRFKPVGIDLNFDEDEKSVMDQTVSVYGRYSAIHLSMMTHAKGTPWDIVYNEIGHDFVIPNDLIEEHYASLYESNDEG